MTVFASRVLPVVVCGFVLGVCGCVSVSETDEEAGRSGAEARAQSQPRPALAAPRSDVRTIQLYRGTNERELPVTSLQGGPPLTLEFDVLEQEGRPLSIYFVHADRTWKNGLMSSQSLESYHDDTLIEYDPSQGTDIRYTHYTYQFPNDDIQFRVSGNFIVRVTERGNRDSVLFERAFFVVENEGTLRSGLESLRTSGHSRSSVRPVAQYDPPPSLRGSPFNFAACFVRNGRLGDIRCEDRPLLMDQPRLAFELTRGQAFRPVTTNYVVDLGDLRSGRRIQETDRTGSPIQVELDPDYAQFSGRRLNETLNGQIVVREAVRNRAAPAVTAEYIGTTFSFVPPNEEPIAGGVSVAGSFTGMDPTRGYEMEWNAGRGQYEARVLLKEGRYQYFYVLADSTLQGEMAQPQTSLQRDVFTTFLYYRDPGENTDRLLQVGQINQ